MNFEEQREIIKETLVFCKKGGDTHQLYNPGSIQGQHWIKGLVAIFAR